MAQYYPLMREQRRAVRGWFGWSQADRFNNILQIVCLLLPITIFNVPAAAAELRLTVQGIHSDQGEILVALYDNVAGFKTALANAATRGLMPDSGRLIGTSIRAQRGAQSTVFTQLPPGRYAVIVIHDENDDGRLNQNGWGVPTEGYGFGNDAQGFLRAPDFDAAAIAIGNTNVSVSVTLIYPKKPTAGDDSDYKTYLGIGNTHQ